MSDATDTTQAEAPNTAGGFIKLARGNDTRELIAASHNGYVLLSVIALRAQRTASFNRYNLKPGEALIGDFSKYGMSEQQYRTAKLFLSTHGFATFKPTTKGTIATLINTRVFDINSDDGNGQSNERPTDSQRTANDYQEVKKAKKAKNSSATDEVWLAELSRAEAYTGLDITREFSKMTIWCSTNHQTPTRRRFVNWLNRARPVNPQAARTAATAVPSQLPLPAKPFNPKERPTDL